MKKKISKKLLFHKTTVAQLDSRQQFLIKGGDTCVASCDTQVCGTCVTQCGTCISDCGPCYTLDCETERPQYCDPFPV